jgi:hypothetical protein
MLELRLSPAAARQALPRGAGATRARPAGRLGVLAVDGMAAAVGAVAFEPVFAGELPPPEGDPLDFTAFHVVHLAPGASLERALEGFRSLPEVASAEAYAILPVSALPNDSLTFATFWLYKDQAARTDIRAPEAWQVTTGDTNIVVAVLDTGIIPWHPDLGGRAGERGQLWANWAERAGAPGVDDDGNGFVDDVAGWDFVKQPEATTAAAGEDAALEDDDPNDWGGHGTAVAGILGATAGNAIGLAGVAPQLRIMPVRMGWLGSGQLPPAGFVHMLFAERAIRYATRNGAHVINASWQSENTFGLDAAVAAATRAGVVVVNAAGNFGTTFTYLGQREDVVSVAATDSTDAVWSNSVVGPWVDLAAAGVSMTSTMFQRVSLDPILGRTPAYRSFLNGTSFAAPQVSGAVALLQARRRELGQDPLPAMGALLRLRETTDDIRDRNPVITNYGTGRLNLHRALTDPPRSLAVRAAARSLGPPVAFRYNTGRSLVVHAMSDRSLIAFDGETGDTVWVRPLPGVPAGALAAAELGMPQGVLIAGATTAGAVFVVHDDGRMAAGWPVTAQAGVNLAAGVAFADVSGDGVPDVVAGGAPIAGSRLWAWHADGTALPGFPFDTGTSGISAPALADLDGVPGAEIAFTDGDGALRVVRGDGSEFPGFPTAPVAGARAPVILPSSGPGSMPIVVVASAGGLEAFDATGGLRWSVALAGPAAQDPALADLDGDGWDEILVAIGSPSRIEARRSSGAAVGSPPGWPASVPSPALGPLVVGPLSADHGPCVGFFRTAGFTALDDSGKAIAAFPKPGGAGFFATIADLDGDDATEVAAGTGVTPLSTGVADTSVYTYDAGARTWNASLAHWPTARGDVGRTASHAGGRPGPLLVDRVRPAMPTTLEASALTTTGARVAYVVTGDDSLAGTAARVELRRATQPLDEGSFDAAILVSTDPPGPPGTRHEVLVTGLPEGSTWWFAARVVDEAGNASALSPPDSAALPGLAPGVITDLRALAVTETTVVLTWTATGDDGDQGRPLRYRLSGSPAPFDASNVDAAPLQLERPASADAGGAETTLVVPLTSGRRWRFAVRGVDRALTLGSISNVLELVTPVGGSLAGRTGVALGARPMPASGAVTLDWQGEPAPNGQQWLLVHDASGRLLRRVALGSEPGGSYNWDGRDGAHRLLPAGLYFVRLVSGTRHADTRVVFVR